MQMINIRLFFSKTGRAKYISHLDTMRTLTRALRRSGLPLWYTQGFNPHLYMTFALPLPLGCEGLRESMDLRLTEEMDLKQVTEIVNGVLPPGFQVLETAPVTMEPAAIAWADYEIRIGYPKEEKEARKTVFDRFETQTEIEVTKRTKKGEKQVDIRPLAKVLSVDWAAEEVVLQMRLAAGIQLNINPSLYLGALSVSGDFPVAGAKIIRKALLTEKHEFFS